MKTVILIRNAETADFTDTDICCVVALAGESTLIIAQRPVDHGAPPSLTGVVRADLRTLAVKTPDEDDAMGSWQVLEQNPSSIWVFDTRDLEPKEVDLALALLRYRIFYLPMPPPAIVLETDVDAHVWVFEQLRKSLALDVKLERSLKRHARRLCWNALLVRLFGPQRSGVTKRLSRVLARLG